MKRILAGCALLLVLAGTPVFAECDHWALYYCENAADGDFYAAQQVCEERYDECAGGCFTWTCFGACAGAYSVCMDNAAARHRQAYCTCEATYCTYAENCG